MIHNTSSFGKIIPIIPLFMMHFFSNVFVNHFSHLCDTMPRVSTPKTACLRPIYAKLPCWVSSLQRYNIFSFLVESNSGWVKAKQHHKKKKKKTLCLLQFDDWFDASGAHELRIPALIFASERRPCQRLQCR